LRASSDELWLLVPIPVWRYICRINIAAEVLSSYITKDLVLILDVG